MKRRNFLTVGGLSLSAFGLPNISLAGEKTDKSVIMLFLAGGMSHAESFIACPDSVGNYRSVTGYTKTKDGFYLGGGWDKLAVNSNLFSLVHSFNHVNPGHQGGTHYIMTGYNLNDENEGAAQNHPSYGSIISRTIGSNNPDSGMPTYVSLQRVFGEKAAYLGSAYNPLSIDGDGKKNLALLVDEERFLQRVHVLKEFDRKFNGRVDKAIDSYKKQGYDMLLGSVKQAFEIEKEPKPVRDAYGDSRVGKQALTARRLVQNGVRFVTMVSGGWDMHNNIKEGMERKVPEIDHAISTLLLDLRHNGMLDNTLVVVATEFGRTQINKDAGRDHWAKNTPLLLAGGKYQGRGIIGEVDKNGFEVKESPFAPIDLLKTILDHMGVNGFVQYTDTSGRPRYLIEGEAKIIG